MDDKNKDNAGEKERKQAIERESLRTHFSVLFCRHVNKEIANTDAHISNGKPRI
jgi:hypothetical protein